MQTISPCYSSVSSSLLMPNYTSMASPQTSKSSVVGPTLPAKTNRTNDVDYRRLILFNLPKDLIREYLELYLEHLSGETEIERIDYSNLDDTTIMVTFKTELDMNEVRRRHATRSKLNDSEVTLAEVKPSATVMVRNLPSNISRDVLELYFSNRRRSDGGQVVHVNIDHESQYALLTFADHQDARRVSSREHSLHGHHLDVRIYHTYMGVEPFIDASTVSKQPEPIRYRSSDDNRFFFLLKNRSLMEKFREQLKSLSADVHYHDEEYFEVLFSNTRCTLHHRLQWSNDIERIVNAFLSEHLLVHKIPWNNQKIPSIRQDQLSTLSMKDPSRLFQLIPLGNGFDEIVIITFKDQLDRALSELTDMLTTLTTSNQAIPLNDAVYRSKPVVTARDPKVDQHRSSTFIRSSILRQSMKNVDVPLPPNNPSTDDYLENLRPYQLDLLSMRFIDLARRTYLNLSIEIERNARRIHLYGLTDQVTVCKNYFQSILDGIVEKSYKIGKEMAIFLSNPDTVEVLIGYLARLDYVCAYEIERVYSNHRRSSLSPPPSISTSSKAGLSTSLNSHSLSSTLSTNTTQHKLIIYSLSREYCDRVYDVLCHDICVSSIMLDKDDRRCLTSDSWHSYVRDLYSTNGGGFRRRRVLLQVKQNQLVLIGFEQDVNAMRQHIYDYFVENAISFYESD